MSNYEHKEKETPTGSHIWLAKIHEFEIELQKLIVIKQHEREDDDQRHQDNQRILQQIKLTLHGNGKTGHEQRLYNLEQSQREVIAFAKWVFGSTGIQLVMLLVNLIRHQ